MCANPQAVLETCSYRFLDRQNELTPKYVNTTANVDANSIFAVDPFPEA